MSRVNLCDYFLIGAVENSDICAENIAEDKPKTVKININT